MGGSSVNDDWEFIANGARTLLLVGRTGDGRSATGNSILGRNAFGSMPSFGGVTTTCEIQRTQLEDGQMLDVIDTPGFDFTAESELVGNEIVKCMDLADGGIHAVLLVLSLRTRFSKEEKAAIQYFSELFGSKISDYTIVVFTGGDELEDDETLNDHLDRSCPELLKEVLKMCGNRQVLFDNKTKDPMKIADQLRELLCHVSMVVQKNDGKPYTKDLLNNVKKMKFHYDPPEVNSLLGDLRQEITELKEQLQNLHKRVTEIVESKIKEKDSEAKETMLTFQKKLLEKRAALLEAKRIAESKARELTESLDKDKKKTEAIKVERRSYSCYKCRTHLSFDDDIASRTFKANSGRAFLFDAVKNVVVGIKEDKQLITGLHTVADIYCEGCNEVLGWKYERAFVESQKYKEGKFILEESKIVKDNW